MPNGNDTDVVSPSDEQEPLAGERIGGEYPALGGEPPPESPEGDVSQPPSMQDIAGATPMASPLGGQQPGQLPAMIAQGAAGAGAQGTPVGAMIHHRHGGLLTGLAGVLLDGIAAGIMTPQSGQGFSQAAQRAYYMPQERQQAQMQMQQFQTQQELDKAKVAMAHVQQLQAYALANRYSDEERAQLTEDDVKQHEEWQRQGLVDQVATTPDREVAAQHVHQMRSQDDPARGDQYWMWPTQHDGQGNVTEWGVYRMDPNKTLGKDQTFYVPNRDPDTGELTMQPMKMSKDMPVWEANAYRTSAVLGKMITAAPKPMTPLQRAQMAKYGANPVLARDPSGRQRLMSTEEAQSKGMMRGAIGQTSQQVQKSEDVITQTNTVQDAFTSYREWMNEVYREGMTPTQKAAIDTLMPRNLGVNVAQLGPYSLAINVPELLARPAQAAALQSLTRSQREAVNAYWNMLNAVPTAQRAMINQGRTNTEVMEIEMRTVPDMLRDAENFNIGMNDYQKRVNMLDRRNPLIEGFDTADQQRAKTESDVRSQIESAKRGELAPGTPLQGGGTAGQIQPPRSAGGRSPDQLQQQGWTWKNGSKGWGWYK